MDVRYYFNLAAKAAMPKHLEDTDVRGFVLGAVGIRMDSALVLSKNGAVHSTSTHNYKRIALAHAEARLCRKLGKRGTVFVVRIARKNGDYVMSRPCFSCQHILESAKVDKVYYSINNKHYGIWLPQEETDYIYEL